MTTYAIGDVQGCFEPLQQLLKKIHFSSDKDQLWFVGDLVNRGPNSLETLRLVKNLQDNAITVLGNHDLHLIAVAYGIQNIKKFDTFNDILQASDQHELIDWLCQQPLLHHDKALGYTMVHAGIAPQWDLQTAKKLAAEVETIFHSSQRSQLLNAMYGNEPTQWSDTLQNEDRWRCIINHFTRMRFCKTNGSLNLNFKGSIKNAANNLIPWFLFPERAMKNDNIIFGHWAALNGQANTPHIFALDTGCVWGNQLTAMNLQTRALFKVDG